jgi:hypothetical protein
MGKPDTATCETCDAPTPYRMSRRCDNCWETEHRLPRYLESPRAREHVWALLLTMETDRRDEIEARKGARPAFEREDV